MESFFVEGSDEVAASKDGAVCSLRLINPEGKTMTLLFPAESAATLASRITTAGQVAAGVAEEMGDTVVALVRRFEVFGSSDGSVIGLMFQSGEAQSSYALTPSQSADLRKGLKAAEADGKSKRKKGN